MYLSIQNVVLYILIIVEFKLLVLIYISADEEDCEFLEIVLEAELDAV